MHPRVHGENPLAQGRSRRPAGASPCARGKRMIGRQVGVGGGCIPVCTGKTSACRAGASPHRVHPRVHGENDGRIDGEEVENGASPCARGKLCAPVGLAPLKGCIPVCTGKTCDNTAPRSGFLSLSQTGRTSISPHPYAFVGPIPCRRVLRNVSGSATRNMPARSMVTKVT